MGPEELFLANLPLIEQLVQTTCRRNRMQPADVDDFASALKLKLIDNNYYVLRQYEGKSSLGTFLFIVIHRFFLDYRDRLWGRWRTSAEAQRHGDAAILLEQLIVRDGAPLEQAFDIVTTKYPESTREQLERIRALLPERLPRLKVEVDGPHFLQIAAASTRADDRIIDGERKKSAERVSRVFAATLAGFSAEEQLILRMRFGSGLKIVTIATALGIDQRKLYRVVDRIIAALRTALIAEGLALDDIADLLEHGAEGIDIPFLGEEIVDASPSNIAAKGDPTGSRRRE
ncbi:MAG: sigma-70 family RNA polymerase sigma factor [Thermoanaerobaculia bacterium]